MSRLKWAIVGCLVLAGGSTAFAEASKPRNILEFLFGNRKSEQPVAVTPAAPQSLAPAARAKAPEAKADKKSTKQASDKKKPSIRRAAANSSSIDPAPRVERSYRGPFRGGGSQAVCVRSCDGFFFPVNYEGASGGDRYDYACQQSCPGAETQVYFMKRGGDIRWASTARGTSYSSLANALKYRKERDPACTCKGSEQRWSSVLAPVEAIMKPGKSDLVVTEETSQRIAQGEDPASLMKAASKTKDTAEAAPASTKRADIAAEQKTSTIRSSFGERIAPSNKFMKIDPTPTGSIPQAKPTNKPAAQATPVSSIKPVLDAKPALSTDKTAKEAKSTAAKTVNGKTASAKPASNKPASNKSVLADKPAKKTQPLAAAPSQPLPPAKATTSAKSATAPKPTQMAKANVPATNSNMDKSALRQALDRLVPANQR